MIQAKGQRVKGTCEWTKKDNTYDRWLHDDTQPPLWIRGSPGKGKTVLSTFLSQKFEVRAATIYFFCRAGVENLDTAIGVLRGLIWHSMAQFPDSARCSRVVLETLRREHRTLDADSQEHMEAALSSRETLWMVFVKLLTESRRLGQTFCVLDGLDECDEDSRDWLVTKFLSLNDVSGENCLKLIITSRELTRLRSAKQVILDLDHNEGVSSDVKTFVRTKCLELTRRISLDSKHREDIEHTFQESIEETLPVRSQNSFLWLGPAMAELMEEETITGVLSTVNHLPQALRAVYERMLGQMKSHQRETSFQILGWLVLARRPLGLPELASAVNCRPLYGWLTVEETIAERIALCGPLLRVEDQKVILVHKYARDYLLLLWQSNEDGLDRNFRVDVEVLHLRISKTCIDALVRDCPLSCYARQHWYCHTKQSGSFSGPYLYYAGAVFNAHLGTRGPCVKPSTIG